MKWTLKAYTCFSAGHSVYIVDHIANSAVHKYRMSEGVEIAYGSNSVTYSIEKLQATDDYSYATLNALKEIGRAHV